jgi:hypothetical protein
MTFGIVEEGKVDLFRKKKLAWINEAHRDRSRIRSNPVSNLNSTTHFRHFFRTAFELPGCSFGLSPYKPKIYGILSCVESNNPKY